MLRIVEHKQRSFFDASYLVPDGRECEFARFYAREILPLVTDRDYEELDASEVDLRRTLLTGPCPKAT